MTILSIQVDYQQVVQPKSQNLSEWSPKQHDTIPAYRKLQDIDYTFTPASQTSTSPATIYLYSSTGVISDIAFHFASHRILLILDTRYI